MISLLIKKGKNRRELEYVWQAGFFASCFTICFSGLLWAQFTSIDIGNPAPRAGTTTVVKAGRDYDVKGFGTMFGFHVGSDRGRFVYARLMGDFDISVQIDSLHPDNPSLSKAGLMVRKSLDSGSLFFGQEVSTNEYHYECDRYVSIFRLIEHGSLEPKFEPAVGNDTMGYTPWGYLPDDCSKEPRPFPNVWLRIKKVGRTYTGYRKENNGEWIKMGERALDLGTGPFAGMYVAPNEHGLGPDNGATAKFRNLLGFERATALNTKK